MSPASSGDGFERAIALHEHTPTTFVDHHLGHGRIEEQILDRPRNGRMRTDCSQRPPREMVKIAGLHVEVVRLQVAELRRQRVEAVVRQRDRLRIL